MDPKVIAERKGLAMARIESALDVLVSDFGMTSLSVDGLRRNYSDPNLTDLYRIEGIAALVEELRMLARTDKSLVVKKRAVEKRSQVQ